MDVGTTVSCRRTRAGSSPRSTRQTDGCKRKRFILFDFTNVDSKCTEVKKKKKKKNQEKVSKWVGMIRNVCAYAVKQDSEREREEGGWLGKNEKRNHRPEENRH